jgi:hypothetical protein
VVSDFRLQRAVTSLHAPQLGGSQVPVARSLGPRPFLLGEHHFP